MNSLIIINSCKNDHKIIKSFVIYYELNVCFDTCVRRKLRDGNVTFSVY